MGQNQLQAGVRPLIKEENNMARAPIRSIGTRTISLPNSIGSIVFTQGVGSLAIDVTFDSVPDNMRDFVDNLMSFSPPVVPGLTINVVDRSV